jgi:hypothetical protein
MRLVEILCQAWNVSRRDQSTARGSSLPVRRLSPQAAQILELFGKDSQLNVYRGELEARPSGAPTTLTSVARRCRKLGNGRVVTLRSGAYRENDR